jgi:hypothetical protein
MSISANFNNTRASLLLDFANSQQLDPRVTFSRSTTAPYYDGKTSVLAEQNLLTYSQDYTNAVWTKSGITNTGASTTAPDGTTTGSLIDDGTSTGFHVLQYSVATNGTVTVSGYVKNINRQYVGLIVFGAGGSSTYISAVFDLANTTNTTSQNGSGYSVTSATITSVGNSWYRITLSGTVSSATLMAIYPSNSATAGYVPSYTGTNQQFYIWGAQLEQRSSVTAYNATTTSALTNYIPQLLTAPINSPRFDFNPTTGESLGLLIEQSSTNLELYSGAVGGTGWTSSNGSINLTAGIAPDGTQTFSKFSEDTTTSIHYIYPNFVTISSGTVYTASFYVKAAGRNFIVFQGDTGLGNLGAYSGFDLATGTLIGLGSGVTSGTITSQGNGVYRISVTAIATGTSARMGVALRTTSGTSAQSYAGDGYSGIYIWGAQLEALAFPTSYISTTSAQVTRASDNASMTGTNFSSWYNPSTISVFLQGSRKVTGVSNQAFFQFGSGDFLALYSLGGNDQVYNQAVGVSGSVNTTLGATTLASKKIAMSYIAGSFQGAYNGTLGTTQTPANLPSNVSVLYLGYTGSGSYLNGWIQKFAFYPIQFTSAQQQSITGS